MEKQTTSLHVQGSPPLFITSLIISMFFPNTFYNEKETNTSGIFPQCKEEKKNVIMNPDINYYVAHT